jgi:hypothetical protein
MPSLSERLYGFVEMPPIEDKVLLRVISISDVLRNNAIESVKYLIEIHRAAIISHHEGFLLEKALYEKSEAQSEEELLEM